jgi:ElaB/YqjD/DUF883 family membrane-anchored ribosome-binding protein
VATEQDAARERVLAARAELRDRLDVLEASGRAAVDIPARIKRSPAKAAAVAGGIGFLVLKGPQRLLGAARKAITGKPAPVPGRMLPDEIEKTLRKLGDDGDKVRGTLERDFASYVKKAEKDRKGLASVMLLAAARPLLARGVRAAGEFLLAPEEGGAPSTRLAAIRARIGSEIEAARERGATGVESVQERVSEGVDSVRERAAEGVGTLRERAGEGVEATRQAAERAKDAAGDRIAAARREDASADRSDDTPPTGI